MPSPRKTQKQIAQRYAGNLRYFTFFHLFRSGKVLAAVLVLIVAALGASFWLKNSRTTPGLEWVNNIGPISQSHAGFAKDCKQCHDPKVAANKFDAAGTERSLDASCLRCHVAHTFHQPNTVVDHSCVSCHHEHTGAGPMKQVADLNCQTCHANAQIMQASAAKGANLPASAFNFFPKDDLVRFQTPHPSEGYTQVFKAFDGDHPEFQIQRDHLTDPNTLKFNHEIHLNGDIPLVNGRKLDCAYCHVPDSKGAYKVPISFAKNCQACHGLQIDPTLPDLQIPHPGGQTGGASASDFILTLPTQYAAYATQKLGMTSSAQIKAFVGKHMETIRQRTRAGEDLVKEVYFADQRKVYLQGQGPAGRALFPGCAYCHEVKAANGGPPIVTKPVTPDRWYVHANFDHSAHLSAFRYLNPDSGATSCESCHVQVRHSSKTSDINLPEKASCLVCHSAKGGVVSTCATCHDYHNTVPATQTVDASPVLTIPKGETK